MHFTVFESNSLSVHKVKILDISDSLLDFSDSILHDNYDVLLSTYLQ